MYRRPKFLEELIRIREEMAREADYDTDLFSELVRSGRNLKHEVDPPEQTETRFTAMSDRPKPSK